MRYRLPDDCAGVTHAGAMLDRARDGTIEAEEGAGPALAPHGIVPVAPEPPVERPAARTRSDDRRMLR